MPIRTSCPQCQTEYELADHLGGKRVVCAECQGTFAVPALPDEAAPVEAVAKADDPPGSGAATRDRPRLETDREGRRRRLVRDDDDPPRRRPASGSAAGPTLGAVAGGVFLLLVVCGGIAHLMSRPKPPPPAFHAGQPVLRNEPLGKAATAEDFCRRGDALAGRLLDGEAEAAYREATRLQPDHQRAHRGLGLVLLRQSRNAAAEAAFREALALKRDDAEAQQKLGEALFSQGRYKEAEAPYREAEALYRAAVRAQPDSAPARCDLGLALEGQGRFDDALVELRRGDELGRDTLDWRMPSVVWVEQAERLAELDRRLPALRRGEDDPASPLEAVEFSWLCQRYRRLPRTAAGLLADAMREDPQVAVPLKGNRYNAACAAALAAAGVGDDGRSLPDKVVLMLRRQALGWLRADLAIYKEHAGHDAGTMRIVLRQMTHWQKDDDLASIRDAAGLARLPDEEQDDWRQLWKDVEALRQRVAAPN
jgi:tetratricopeptide (TPR) repeat protein